MIANLGRCEVEPTIPMQLREKIEASIDPTEKEILCPEGNPNCDGLGNEHVSGKGYRPCSCVVNKYREKRIAAFLRAIQAKHQGAVLAPDDLDSTETLTAGKEFLEGISRKASIYTCERPLLLCGDYGNGKTMTCTYVAGQLLRRDPWIVLGFWNSFQSLVEQVIFGCVRDGQESLLASRQYVRRVINDSDVVIIDEFGRAGIYNEEKLNQVIDQIAYEAANAAVEGRKPVLIATNYKAKEFLNHRAFFGATRSRLESPVWRRVQTRPGDMRRKPPEQGGRP